MSFYSSRLYDMRAPHTCNSQTSNILIDLRRHAGSTVECRCITIHPARPELIAVGVNDPFIRIYDRRMIKVNSSQVMEPVFALFQQRECGNKSADILKSVNDLQLVTH